MSTLHDIAKAKGLDHGTSRFFTLTFFGHSRILRGKCKVVGIHRGFDNNFYLITARDARANILSWDDRAQQSALEYLAAGYLL